jgi:hypothetical protein
VQILAIASLSSAQFDANPFLMAGAPFPKFVNPCSTLSHELRKRRGTSKSNVFQCRFSI